jgi:hypothetical protein
MATKAKFKLELKAGFEGAQFQAGDEYVELTSDSPTFETDDPNLFAELSQLPFLKGTAEKTSEKAGG